MMNLQSSKTRKIELRISVFDGVKHETEAVNPHTPLSRYTLEYCLVNYIQYFPNEFLIKE